MPSGAQRRGALKDARWRTERNRSPQLPANQVEPSPPYLVAWNGLCRPWLPLPDSATSSALCAEVPRRAIRPPEVAWQLRGSSNEAGLPSSRAGLACHVVVRGIKRAFIRRRSVQLCRTCCRRDFCPTTSRRTSRGRKRLGPCTFPRPESQDRSRSPLECHRPTTA